MTINNNLTLNAGLIDFDLGTNHLGGNDQIMVGGTLYLNGGVIHLNALDGTTNLDGGDFVLIATTNGISGTLPSIYGNTRFLERTINCESIKMER